RVDRAEFQRRPPPRLRASTADFVCRDTFAQSHDPCSSVFFANMIHVLSLLSLAYAAAAVREDIGLLREHSSLMEVEAEADEEMEMKMVPAKISKAIRRSMRLTAEASKVAEEKKEKAAEVAEHAAKKASEADAELEKANRMKDELEIGATKLEQVKQEAQAKLESGKEAQAAWKKEKDALKTLETEYTAENQKYDKLCKEIEEEIKQRLLGKQKAKLALAEMNKKKKTQTEKVEKLAAETAAAGGIAREAQEAAEKADAQFQEATKKCDAQKAQAEKAASVAATARVAETLAKEEVTEADEEVMAKKVMKQQIVELRNSVQEYYEFTDAMTRSMEEALAKLEEKSEEEKVEPWELMRKDVHVKSSMVKYNVMVGQFRRLFFENFDIYSMVVSSTKEIHDNAQAAWLLQCDPNEVLEIEARKTGSLAKLDEHCGRGLWKHFEVERQNFPSKEEVGGAEKAAQEMAAQTAASNTPETSSEESTVPKTEPETEPNPETQPTEPNPQTEPNPETELTGNENSNTEQTETESNEDSEPKETGTNEDSEPKETPTNEETATNENAEPTDMNEDDISNAEPADETSNDPALIQVRDLDLLREIRKHRAAERRAR
ncbi:unnamed protein product, partial [Durusdinium trenchii]